MLAPKPPLQPPPRIHWGWWVLAAVLCTLGIFTVLGGMWVASSAYVP